MQKYEKMIITTQNSEDTPMGFLIKSIEPKTHFQISTDIFEDEQSTENDKINNLPKTKIMESVLKQSYLNRNISNWHDKNSDEGSDQAPPNYLKASPRDNNSISI